jgi:hypothetical protein
MALPEAVPRVQAKIKAGEPLQVSTSNPRSLDIINAKRIQLDEEDDQSILVLQPSAVYGGQMEKLPKLLSRLDGTVDLVRSSRSRRKQGLDIVVDNLDCVNLYAIWAVMRQRNV